MSHDITVSFIYKQYLNENNGIYASSDSTQHCRK